MGSAKTRERKSVCEVLRLERERETVGNAKTGRERERLLEVLRLERECVCVKC